MSWTALRRVLFGGDPEVVFTFLEAPDGNLILRDPLRPRQGYPVPDVDVRQTVMRRFVWLRRISILMVIPLIMLIPHPMPWYLTTATYWLALLVMFVAHRLLQFLLIRPVLKDLERIPLPERVLVWEPPKPDPAERRAARFPSPPPRPVREVLRDIVAFEGWRRWVGFIAICVAGMIVCLIRALRGVAPDGSLELGVVFLILAWMSTYMLYRKAEDARFGIGGRDARGTDQNRPGPVLN